MVKSNGHFSSANLICIALASAQDMSLFVLVVDETKWVRDLRKMTLFNKVSCFFNAEV